VTDDEKEELDNRLSRDMQRGERGRQLMSDELLQEAFASIREQYVTAAVAASRGTKPAEERAALRLMDAVSIVERVKEHLGRAIQDGDAAALNMRDVTGAPRFKILA
jgi:hypothetical protein